MRRLEELHQAAVLPADENREDVALVARRTQRRMVAVIDAIRVTVARHHDLWFRAATVGVVAELRAEAGLRPVAVVINFLVVRLLRYPIGVVFVRRIPRPAAGIAVEFAHEQVSSATRRVLPQNVKNPPTRMRVVRADLNHFNCFGSDPKRREGLRAGGPGHGDFGAVAEGSHRDARGGAAVNGVRRAVPDRRAATDVFKRRAVGDDLRLARHHDAEQLAPRHFQGVRLAGPQAQQVEITQCEHPVAELHEGLIVVFAGAE